MAFHVGQKVCCIKSGKWQQITGVPSKRYPKKGEIFTVASIEEWENETWLEFSEIQGEHFFWGNHFRPLQEQGMSILRAILADPKVKIKETA